MRSFLYDFTILHFVVEHNLKSLITHTCAIKTNLVWLVFDTLSIKEDFSLVEVS